jgi:uncharacterized membrane protein YdjX (TVP38/TMEM64 family)
VCVVLFVAWTYRSELRQIEPWIEQHSVTGALVYVLAGAASVVLLPFSSLPLVPLAARIWGVWIAGALSAAGWWIGALLAFWIARLARPSLDRFVSLSALDRLERSIPPDVGFATIVALRLVLPVDVTSFALGLLRNLRFAPYAIASLIGILPFAFVWSYAGSKLASGQYLLFAALAAALILIGVLARRYWSARNRPKQEH